MSCIVIGSDVDALVAAHCLARAGRRVIVIQDRLEIDAQFAPGWMPPAVVSGLELEKHGFAVEEADPWLATVLPDGRRFALYRDLARSADSIRDVSAPDAVRWPEFCRRMHVLAGALASLYAEPPPDPLARTFGELARLGASGFRMRRLGAEALADLLRVAPMSIADLLDEWFESDALKAVLACGGVLHLAQGVRSGGTAFNFLHHHVGASEGVFRPPRTNAARVLRALAYVEAKAGKVAKIVVRQERAAGVVLASGEEIAAQIVVSAAGPRQTLLEWSDPARLDPELVRAVRNVRSRGVASQVTLTLDRDPGFTTLTIAPSLDYLERAYDDVKYGRMSAEPWLEARYSKEERRHRVDVHVQYTPHALRHGEWNDQRRDALARAVVERLSRHMSVQGAVAEVAVGSPLDLERARGAPEGQVYHAELALDQLLWMRPVPDLARYRTPIRGLYLCGPAMHPGAGIAGASGMHAARAILRDIGKSA